MKNVLSLESFLNWVEKKNPEEEYYWKASGYCACGQYADDIGVKNWSNRLVSPEGFWSQANEIAGPNGQLTFENYVTFGELAKRLHRKLETVE